MTWPAAYRIADDRQIAADTETKVSAEALQLAEALVNHQWGIGVARLALHLDNYRAAGVRETIKAALAILHEEGWLGDAEKRIRALAEADAARGLAL